MKPNRYIMLAMLLLFFTATYSEAGWLIYHKPEFRGKVIDTETKEPIEGAVVVVAYYKIFYYIVDTSTDVIEARETLTDKNGEFYFPSYTTVIGPFSGEKHVSFIFYKAGYSSYPVSPKGLTAPSEETFFSKRIGDSGVLEGSLLFYKDAMINVTFGVVELSKVKTREERLKTIPIWPTESPGVKRAQELPLLYKAIFDEDKRLGLREGKK